MFSRELLLFSQDGFSSRAGLTAVSTSADAGTNTDVVLATSASIPARVTARLQVRLLTYETRVKW